MSEPGRPFRILVVCTGNICRSPAAERLLRSALGRLSDPWSATVESAGVGAVVGHPVQERMAALLRADGVEADGFAARQLTPQLVAAADVVLVADRTHREAVLRTVPTALRRTFMLKEFVRLALLVADDDPPVPVGERLRWLLGRVPLMRGRSPAPEGADDIADPYGGSDDDYRIAYDDIRQAVNDLVTGPLAY